MGREKSILDHSRPSHDPLWDSVLTLPGMGQIMAKLFLGTRIVGRYSCELLRWTVFFADELRICAGSLHSPEYDPSEYLCHWLGFVCFCVLYSRWIVQIRSAPALFFAVNFYIERCNLDDICSVVESESI
mmetsp:Transcript_4177/g.15760  ORF Transcript_4177/g.15760 Transcript_4177/m.15760 type:complete len:130 (+) Transcript_4177:888-1277(+)